MKIVINGKTIELDKDQITKAMEEENPSIEVTNEDFIIRTKKEQDKFLDNIKGDVAKTALEMEVKKFKNDLDLDFQGKTIENLIEAITEKNKNEFSKEPNEQLQAKEKDIQTLKQTLEGLMSEKETALNQLTEFKNQTTLSRELESNLPDDLAIPKEDMIYLIQKRLNPTFQDGKVVYKKGEEILKDSTTLDPLGTKDVLTNFFSENKHYLKGLEGGKGKGDEGGSEGNTFSVFNEKMKQSGIESGTVEYNKKLNEAVQNKEVDPSHLTIEE